MDLSAVIFVALALAWAVYLIPKALKHHDEIAAERLDESHSDQARVLTRRRTTVGAETVTTEEVVEVEVSEQEVAKKRRPRQELTVAGRAARNRRRVLALLLTTLATVWAFTWFAYLPSWAPAIPTVAVVGWLVVARMSVVRMKRARRARAGRTPVTAPVEEAAEPAEPVAPAAPTPTVETHPLDSRPEVVAEQQALADDGALWDPLPLTLPTYVGKATARRTVRTIELTGVTSSGHDAADSALAREAEESRQAATDTEAEQRRVAGA